MNLVCRLAFICFLNIYIYIFVCFLLWPLPKSAEAKHRPLSSNVDHRQSWGLGDDVLTSVTSVVRWLKTSKAKPRHFQGNFWKVLRTIIFDCILMTVFRYVPLSEFCVTFKCWSCVRLRDTIIELQTLKFPTTHPSDVLWILFILSRRQIGSKLITLSFWPSTRVKPKQSIIRQHWNFWQDGSTYYDSSRRIETSKGS